MADSTTMPLQLDPFSAWFSSTQSPTTANPQNYAPVKASTLAHPSSTTSVTTLSIKTPSLTSTPTQSNYATPTSPIQLLPPKIHHKRRLPSLPLIQSFSLGHAQAGNLLLDLFKYHPRISPNPWNLFSTALGQYQPPPTLSLHNMPPAASTLYFTLSYGTCLS